MIYDFETLVSRKNTGSGKWDEMTKEHPNLPETLHRFPLRIWS